MSADIANWLQVNILNNPQIFRGILALIIMMIGGILWSPKKPVEKGSFKRSSGALIFVFGIFTFLYAFIANLADVFTVWATLVLAGVAVFSFEENRRLRKQYKEREERDRKERLLNEIIEWAEDIGKCGIEPDIELHLDYRIAGAYDYDTTTREIEDGEGKSDKVIVAEIKHRKQLLTHILMYRTKNNYMSIIAPKINKELGVVMTEVVSGLDKQLGLLRKALIDVEHTSTTDISLEMGKLTKSATKLIKEATKIKAKDIGKKENMSKVGDEITESNEPTIKDIEEHLKKQDKQIARGTYTTGAAVGAAIILVAVSLWIERVTLSQGSFYWHYIFLLVVGFGFMAWCGWKQSRIK